MKLYDFVFNIIGNKSSFKNYTEKERTDYNQFMINKVLSMDYDLLPISQLNNSFINSIPDEVFDIAMRKFVPNKRYNLKYKKKKREIDKKAEEIIEKISTYYDIPYRDATMYYEKYLTDDQIKYILEAFGIYEEQ